MAVLNEASDIPDLPNDTTPLQEGDTFNGTISPEFEEDWIPVECCNQVEMSPGLQSRNVTRDDEGSKA